MKRRIVEKPAVMEAVNEAEKKWSRAIDVWETATWVLVHSPEAGKALTESGRVRSFTVHGAHSVGMPDLTLVYEDDDPFLYAIEARFAESRMKYVPQTH